MTERFIKFKILELNDCTITVQIEDVVWGKYKDYKGNEVDIQRGNCKYISLKEYFNIWSCTYPELHFDGLVVFGDNYVKDNNVVSYEYITQENAQEVYSLLKSIAIEDNKNVIKKLSTSPLDFNKYLDKKFKVENDIENIVDDFRSLVLEIWLKGVEIENVKKLQELTHKLRSL